MLNLISGIRLKRESGFELARSLIESDERLDRDEKDNMYLTFNRHDVYIFNYLNDKGYFWYPASEVWKTNL